MKSNRHIITFLLTSFILISCNESASSKIKSDNQNKTQVQQSYAEITFDRIFHDFGTIKEGEIAKTVFSFTNTGENDLYICLLYTSPSPRDATLSRMPSSA